MSEKREGPKIEMSARCTGCAHLESEHYAVQGDSGYDHSCTWGTEPKRIGLTRTTPEWCSFLLTSPTPEPTESGGKAILYREYPQESYTGEVYPIKSGEVVVRWQEHPDGGGFIVEMNVTGNIAQTGQMGLMEARQSGKRAAEFLALLSPQSQDRDRRDHRAMEVLRKNGFWWIAYLNTEGNIISLEAIKAENVVGTGYTLADPADAILSTEEEQSDE